MILRQMLKKAAFLCIYAVLCSPAQISRADTVIKEEGILVNAEVFPDAQFRQIVSQQADTDGDGILSDPEIRNVTKMNIAQAHPYPRTDCDIVVAAGEHPYDGTDIDLTGIELFQNLEMLIFHNVHPKTIPFAELKALKQFYLTSAPAIELDFFDAGSLEIIAVTHVQLTGIDLSKNAGLKNLRVQRCGLSQIDLTGCRNLEELNLDRNAFEKLDLSNNPYLKTFSAEYNKFSKLDFRQNDHLERLYIDNNSFTKIDKSTLKVSDKNSLLQIKADRLDMCTVLDVSHLDRLKYVRAMDGKYKKVCIGKELLHMNIAGGRKHTMTVLDSKTFKAPQGAKLKKLECYDGNFQKLDLRHLKNLRTLDAGYNNSRLTEIDLSGNLKLEILDLPWDHLKKLVISRKASSEDKKYYSKMMKKYGGKLILR